MTKKEFFDKYKAEYSFCKCSYCKKCVDYILTVGTWEKKGATAADICEKCFMEVLND